MTDLPLAACLHQDTLTTTVNIDPETDHRETMCCRCYHVLADVFLPATRIETGQSNYTRMEYATV